MVKDTRGRFKSNGLWGDGWGWAFFNADDPATSVTEDYKAECIPCHVPAEKDAWIYVRGYRELNNWLGEATAVGGLVQRSRR